MAFVRSYGVQMPRFHNNFEYIQRVCRFHTTETSGDATKATLLIYFLVILEAQWEHIPEDASYLRFIATTLLPLPLISCANSHMAFMPMLQTAISQRLSENLSFMVLHGGKAFVKLGWVLLYRRVGKSSTTLLKAGATCGDDLSFLVNPYQDN